MIMFGAGTTGIIEPPPESLPYAFIDDPVSGL